MDGRGGVRKPFLELAGATVLERSAAALAAAPGVESIVIVVHPDDLERARELARTRAALGRVRAVLAGGAQRVDSVRAGALDALRAGAELVCIHDAARPLVRPESVQAAIEAAADGAAALALPVRDTIHVADRERRIESTPERSTLWAAQTPQVFDARRFAECLERARRDGFVPTDDAALWTRYVGPVRIVDGDPENLKITTSDDLALAAARLEARERRR